VVIAIISILAAMLLPALEEARFMARRISCLSDRRQNHLQLMYFTKDHDGRVPCLLGQYSSPSSYWDGSTDFPMRDWTGISTDHIPTNHFLKNRGPWGRWVTSLGTLSVRGYVEDPRLLYCPDYTRVYGQYWDGHQNEYPNWHLDDSSATCGHGGDGDLPIWECLTNGDSYCWPSSGSHYYIGIAHYLHTGTPTNAWEKPDHRRPRLSLYAQKWQQDNVSPLLVSCVNHPPDIYDSSPLTGIWNMEPGYPYGTSHDARGVNGAFYDGSARWISRDEVQAGGQLGIADYMRTDARGLKANMQRWAQQKARP
jgi:hypothetical protein